MTRSAAVLAINLLLVSAYVRATVTVTVSPRTASVTFTQTQQFKATVSGSTNLAVTWFVDGIAGGSSTVGFISSSGLYTPPHVWGGHTVKARSVADTTKSASVQVVVTNYGAVDTYRYDKSRSGLNASEIVLTTANVNSSHFGKLFSRSLDGNVNAQPVYMANLANLPDGHTHNVVFVATENDSVYAFDADGRTTTPLWRTNFIPPNAGVTTVPCADVQDCSIPSWGITGTPVIDIPNKTMFVVVRTKENGTYVQRLHWLDITTGVEKAGGPVVIAASVPGTGAGSSNGTVSFDPLRENNRAALLLLNGIVYVAFGSSSDVAPYHGWLLGYQPNYTAHTFSLVSILNTTPNGSDGALWNVGALAADTSGNIFCGTGNGTFTTGTAYGDSWLRIATGGGLTVMDSFTPHNQATLNSGDEDVGSSGPLLLPFKTSSTQKNLLIAGSKQGTIYVLDRANLGGYHTTDQIVQSITSGVFPQYTAPVYWNGHVYFAGNGPLQAFTISGSTGLMTFFQKTAHSFGFYENPVVSSKSNANGIVWVLERLFASGTSTGILHAYDATNLGHELYNSTQVASRDAPNEFLRFQPPVVVNGKVYIAGHDLSGSGGHLVAYGLLP